ncbi:hypothetical protein ACJRPK_09845 [Aquimarina sp. 2-A2]|uniref:hypothetical protein n=1 Tax=Aquimarina sp. 2-A2 TaxID=3382644 RepID=UPI00387EF541
MQNKVYQVDAKKIKTVFFGEEYLSFSRQRIEDSNTFINSFKDPKLYDKLTRIKPREIKKVKFKEGTMDFEAYIQNNDMVYKETMRFKDQEAILDFAKQLESIKDLKRVDKKENKFLGVLNHSGFYIVISGSIVAYFLALGETNFSENAGRAKNKLAGKILDGIISFLGVELSLVAIILIIILGGYSMYKKFNRPSNLIQFKTLNPF